MMKKRIPTAILTIAMIVSLFALGAVPAAAAQGDGDSTPITFTDVASDHPAIKEIEYCVKNGFVRGFGNGTFIPDGEISREHFVTVWARTFHARMHDFSDATKTKDEIDTAIVLMYGLGYINGVSTTRFSRFESITREQVAQIVKNTYLPGVDGDDMYTAYADGSTVSEWARNAVSVMRDKGIFSGIIKDNKFQPTQPITRAEVCVIVYNLMKVMNVKYSITVNATGSGIVTPNKTSAAAGELVTLSVDPASGMRLKAGTLKYNDTEVTGEKFVMPAMDVVVTAEFEAIPILDSIEIKTEPKVEYVVGEALETTGLVITARYTNADPRELTADFTTNPAAGKVLALSDTGDVVVSYTEGAVTKTASYSILVSAAT